MITARGLTHVYRRGTHLTRALDRVDLDVARGEFVCLRGASGSGKTTLLLALGGMLRPTAGDLRVIDTDLYDLSRAERGRFRATSIGFVFQMFHLVPYLDLTHNLMLADTHGRLRPDEADELLERVGLSDRRRHTPEQLSAGERQRAAVMRATVGDPPLVLADEPTGNLDPDNAEVVHGLLSEFHARGGTVVVATHGDLGAGHADRVLSLDGSRLLEVS